VKSDQAAVLAVVVADSVVVIADQAEVVLVVVIAEAEVALVVDLADDVNIQLTLRLMSPVEFNERDGSESCHPFFS